MNDADIRKFRAEMLDICEAYLDVLNKVVKSEKIDVRVELDKITSMIDKLQYYKSIKLL